MICMIAAASQDGVIGNQNKLPWHLPEDLKHFRKLTLNQNIVMGRKTFESLPGLLPKRNHIVLTRNKDWSAPGVKTYDNIDKVLKRYKNLYIIGGEEIYRQFLPLVDKLYLTVLYENYEGDAFFPDPEQYLRPVYVETFIDKKFSFIEMVKNDIS